MVATVERGRATWLLLDGDGRRQAVDGVHVRLLHLVEELPGVGGEGFDVPALPFGVDGVEGQGGFPGTAQAGNDDELVARDVDVRFLRLCWRARRTTIARPPNSASTPAGAGGGDGFDDDAFDMGLTLAMWTSTKILELRNANRACASRRPMLEQIKNKGKAPSALRLGFFLM